MREVTRLISLALVTCLVMAAAILVSNSNLIGTQDTSLVAADEPASKYPPRFEEDAYQVRVPLTLSDQWQGLQGFPSQKEWRFPIPDDAPSAQLQLDLESVVIDGGSGLLDVYLNGALRDAVVLEPGRHRHRLTYGLSGADVAAGEVVLRLEDDGTTGGGSVCPTNVVNAGVSVQILPRTALVARRSQPLDDPHTFAALLPPPLQLGAEPDVIQAAWAAQWLARQGVVAEVLATGDPNVIIKPGDQPLPLAIASNTLEVSGTQGVEELARVRGAALPAVYAMKWPLPISALTSDTKTHNFRGSTRWSLDYQLADLPDGRVPGEFQIRVKPTPLQDGNVWSLRVTLNGNLLYGQNYAGDTSLIAASIVLPPDQQTSRNRITVTLVDQTPNRSICRSGPDAAAQLLETSELSPASGPANDEQALIEKLAAASGVNLVVSGSLGREQVSEVSGMLSLLLPLDVKPSIAGGTPIPSVVAANREEIVGEIAKQVELGRQGFLVTRQATPSSSELKVQKLTRELEFVPSPVLVITW